MSKADRDMSLKTRLDAIEVVRNIRKARKLLTSSKFDDKLFDQIQGDDNGVDRLVGRSVMFGALSDTEKLALRREINAKLFESEQTAFGALREATLEYMTDLNKTIDGIKLDPTDEKVIMDLSSTKRKALEAFEGAKLSAGTLDAERNLSALEHIEAIAERILDLTNGMTALLDEAENAEEQEGGDDDSKRRKRLLPTEMTTSAMRTKTRTMTKAAVTTKVTLLAKRVRVRSFRRLTIPRASMRTTSLTSSGSTTKSTTSRLPPSS